jgi:hypothetical protein
MSETSRNIAHYVIQHGSNPHTVDGQQKAGYPGHYRIERTMSDGRTLSIYYGDVNMRGADDPMPNSSLVISLTPVRNDQFGYETHEYGLTGEFEIFRLMTGTIRQYPEGWLHFNRGEVSEPVKEKIQTRYELVLAEVHAALRGE